MFCLKKCSAASAWIKWKHFCICIKMEQWIAFALLTNHLWSRWCSFKIQSRVGLVALLCLCYSSVKRSEWYWWNGTGIWMNCIKVRKKLQATFHASLIQLICINLEPELSTDNSELKTQENIYCWFFKRIGSAYLSGSTF